MIILLLLRVCVCAAHLRVHLHSWPFSTCLSVLEALIRVLIRGCARTRARALAVSRCETGGEAVGSVSGCDRPGLGGVLSEEGRGVGVPRLSSGGERSPSEPTLLLFLLLLLCSSGANSRG